MRTRSSRKGLAMKRPAAKKEPKRVLCAEPIKSSPAKERPRERLLADGPARLSDAELLAVIFRVGSGSFKGGVSGKSAYDLALSRIINLVALQSFSA